jgi:excinuclease ABC subunit A
MKNIRLLGVKQNNLKNIDVEIPLGSFTVVCGPSGSGKSTLAFETLFAEGQRRFIESMSSYARQFLNKAPKPDLEGTENIPPSISIEQKNAVKSSRSTVGTSTELIDYIRLLFEKIGVAHCPDHHCPTTKESSADAAERTLEHFKGKRGYVLSLVAAKDRVADGKKLHSLLLQDGILRIFVQKKESTKIIEKKAQGSLSTTGFEGEVIDISAPEVIKKGLPKGDFYLVHDRTSFKDEDRNRLVDSIDQAYDSSIKYNSGVAVRACLVANTDGEVLKFSDEASCPICGYCPPPISSKLFSFNSPLGACPTCKGFGNILDVDENKVVPDPSMSIAQGALSPFSMPSAEQDKKALLAFCKKVKIDIHEPWNKLPAADRKKIWDGDKDFFGVKGLFEYLEQIKYKMHVRVFIARYRSPFQCTECGGARLRKEANDVFIGHYNIDAFTKMTIEELHQTFLNLKLNPAQKEVANEVYSQISNRLGFLVRVGVNYLTLARETRTLSGGEYQRLNLAKQLGMGLSQTLYVLDEPTVGLHPRDNDRLISILKDLKNLGNTLVVVEHDHDVIKNSDNIVEMGPGSGYLGGEVVFSGKTAEFFKSQTSNTAKFVLPGKKTFELREVRPFEADKYRFKIELLGATGNNLQNVDVTIPLNRLVAITGVSGSGKSTLITKTLYPAVARALGVEFDVASPFKSLEGYEHLKNVLLIDQSPIGKSARSSPITYLKAFDAIRNLMAATFEAKARGYTPGTFSLNVDGGRCPVCKGTGYEEIDMMFMDNVIIPCDACDGKKYRDEVLEIEYNKKNINQILKMTVAEAMNFFVAHPNIRKPLSVLKEVGLEYIQLGQPANSLSGGESQRLKIAKELSSVSQKSTLYILDEPTTGLHFREIDLLMNVLHKLIEAGSSIVVVEHNLDVIRGADYIIDLGPDAGQRGGQIVATGTPTEIIKNKQSLTGQYLSRYLAGN